jgi:hypothetical protein
MEASNHSDAFRRCLVECDVQGMRRLWAHVRPNLPQPRSDRETLATIHYARTVTKSIPLRLRAYSHSYLLDHDLPSGLPDKLKPMAERLYPRVVEGVGISVNAKSEMLKPAVPIIRGAMEGAVEDAYSHSTSPDPAFVKIRMFEARSKTIKQLFGSLGV